MQIFSMTQYNLSHDLGYRQEEHRNRITLRYWHVSEVGTTSRVYPTCGETSERRRERKVEEGCSLLKDTFHANTLL